MLKRGLVLFLFITSLLAPTLYWFKNVEADTGSSDGSILITEVQTGGCSTYDLSNPPKCTLEDGKAEFVEIYNSQESDVDISNWRVEYLSAAHIGIDEPTRTLATLSGTILAKGYVLLSYVGYIEDADFYFGIGSTTTSGLLAKSGGHVRIVSQVDNEINVIDQVGWGTATNIGNWPRTSEIPPGYSIKRILPDDPLFGLGLIFTTPTQPLSPQYGGLILPPEEPSSEESLPTVTCEGIVISELLPNPAGADGGKEFIELYNPTDETILLQGCSLQTTANSKTFPFEEVTMQPGDYLALYDSQTGLTLANSAGGTAWLLSPTEEIQAINYPSNMEDDTAWALFSTAWQKTYLLTPHAANVLVATKPCPSGQVRNPETNRCRSILTLSVSTLGSCRDGYERNPETNRCRKIYGSDQQLVPCKPGQYRNPETNRCRKVENSSGLKPCSEGQFRNPATNRCKKLSDGEVAGIATVKDVESAESNTPFQWGIAGVVALGAIEYGLYEWRRDIFNAVRRLRNRQ